MTKYATKASKNPNRITVPVSNKLLDDINEIVNQIKRLSPLKQERITNNSFIRASIEAIVFFLRNRIKKLGYVPSEEALLRELKLSLRL